MGRPRKNVEEAATAAPEVSNVSALATQAGLTPEIQAALIELAKGVAVSATDAALVFIGDNLGKVNFGSWNPMIVSIGGLVVSQLRNLLHGGRVSATAEDLLKAMATEMPEVK